MHRHTDNGPNAGQDREATIAEYFRIYAGLLFYIFIHSRFYGLSVWNKTPADGEASRGQVD